MTETSTGSQVNEPVVTMSNNKLNNKLQGCATKTNEAESEIIGQHDKLNVRFTFF